MIHANWIDPGAYMSFSHLLSVAKKLKVYKRQQCTLGWPIILLLKIWKFLKSLKVFDEAAIHSVVTSDPLVSPNGNPDIGAELYIVHKCTLHTALHKTDQIILYCTVLLLSLIIYKILHHTVQDFKMYCTAMSFVSNCTRQYNIRTKIEPKLHHR